MHRAFSYFSPGARAAVRSVTFDQQSAFGWVGRFRDRTCCPLGVAAMYDGTLPTWLLRGSGKRVMAPSPETLAEFTTYYREQQDDAVDVFIDFISTYNSENIVLLASEPT